MKMLDRIYDNAVFFFWYYKEDIIYLTKLLTAYTFAVAAVVLAVYSIKYFYGDSLSKSLPWSLFIMELCFVYMIVFLVEGLTSKNFLPKTINYAMAGLAMILWVLALQNIELILIFGIN